MKEDRFHDLLNSSSIAVVKDSKGNCQGKVIDMTHDGDAFKNYTCVKHMISYILDAFSMNESQLLDMRCLNEMLSWLINGIKSTHKMQWLLITKLMKFHFKFSIIYHVYLFIFILQMGRF